MDIAILRLNGFCSETVLQLLGVMFLTTIQVGQPQVSPILTRVELQGALEIFGGFLLLFLLQIGKSQLGIRPGEGGIFFYCPVEECDGFVELPLVEVDKPRKIVGQRISGIDGNG